MKFEIKSASCYHDPYSLLNDYPCLKDFNFVEKEFQSEIFDDGKEYGGEIEINSIEELEKLIKAINYPLIFGDKWFQNRDGVIEVNSIEIYDDWIE